MMQDRGDMDPPAQDHLSPTGSRSLLKQLKPKGAGTGLLKQGKPKRSDSSSEDERATHNTGEDAPDGNNEDVSSSSTGSPDQSTTAPQLKLSPFRSMLRGGGASGALAVRDRLGRLRKRGSDHDGGRLLRLGRGNRMRGDKAGSRPPVQHAESLSSDEGTKESGSTKEASFDNNMVSPASSSENGFVLSPGGLATSSSDDSSKEYDEEEDVESPRRRGKGAGKGGGGLANSNSLSSKAGKANPQTSQLRNGLFRLTRRKSRQPPAPRLSAPSNSSFASSTEDEDKARDHPGTDSSPKSSKAGGLPLLDNNRSRKQQPTSHGIGSRLGRSKQNGNSSRGRQRTSTGTETAAAGSDSDDDPTSRSSRAGGAPLRERRREWMLPSWQRLVGGWGRLGDAGEHEMAAVSGVGRPAAGMLENTMYSWFGGVVGRAWPGVGLALNPVVSDEDAKQISARVKPQTSAFDNDVVRVHVIATDALPEDSRITRPMIVVHIVDSSTGRYLRRSSQPKELLSSVHAADKDGSLLELPPERSGYDEAGRVRDVRHGRADGPRARQQLMKTGMLAGEGVAAETESAGLGAGGTTTFFEERTVWNLTDSGKPETGHACGSVPPAATKPWMMTMSSSTPVWEESLIFAESYRRLLAPDSLVLFELVDFAAALSRKEARKGGGLSKIAWAFLRPIGASGECNVGVRSGDHSPPLHSSDGSTGDCARTSRLQLFRHQPLSVLAKWQARQRGFPRLSPPVASEVPDVFLQFLLVKRTRYPATLAVSVGPTPRLRPVRVMRRPMAPHEREGHQLSYEALAAMHQKSREDREKDEAAGILPGSNVTGGDGDGGVRASATTAARSRRFRAKNEPCVLPDRLLHRVYAGQNGAITLAFSGSGALLAAACCDDPLPGRFPIRLIDSETGRCRLELKGHASMVYSLMWSPGDSLLLSASADGTAKVWRISGGSDAEGVRKGGLNLGDGGTRSVGAPASAEGLPSTARRGGRDEQPRLACVLQHAPPCFVYAAVFQPAEVVNRTRGATVVDHPPSSEASECALVVTGAYDRRLRLWDIAAATAAPAGGRGKMLGTLSSKTVHESHVNAIVYDAKNSRLYSGDGAGVIVVWRRSSGGQGGGGAGEYGVLRKVQHTDLVGKAITSLALAPRLRRGQLLVQAHGNTLRLLDLGTYQLVNPGFAGGATAESLIRASFSPDGRFVVSGSERGQVRVWEAQEGNRVRTPLQSLGTACCLRDVAWHPHQHVLALAGYGQDAPVLLYCGEGRADKQDKREVEAFVSSSSMEEQAAREAQASAEEHRRRLANRQRLRELRIKRLRAKALGLADGPLACGSTGSGNNRKENGVAAALAALTAAGQKAQQGVPTTTAAAES